MGSEYGLELVIPDGFIEKLQKADEELEYTAMQAEETKERVIKSFKEMGDQGVDYLLNKLKEMQKAIGGISTKNINLKNLENSTKNIAQSADDVVRVADAFGQVGNASVGMDGAIKNINTQLDSMWTRLKEVRNDITLYYEAIGSGHKEEMQFGQEGLKKANEEAEQLMKRIEALEVTRAKLEQSGDVSALNLERSRQEMEMLNEAYRTGTSELQKQAKIEDDNAKALVKQAKEQEKLQKAQERADAKAQKDAERRTREQEKINKLKEEEQRRTYEGSLNFSQNATSIAQETQAIKYLTVARDNLSKTDADYQKKLNILNNTIEKHQRSILKAKGETQQFEKQERSLINTSDQLRRKLGLLFSVSAIEGYMKKMVEVRGEFELQKVALTAILQNKEKADQLWAQTQELALKSPFRLQQLVTFTKQLAAYQVQAESLYDTTKRLADVSAGLGVDMGRLILAYGQVKAANYLRSAEIRQFTEAGINMLGELSKLYTELEGKMVSVGEVQSRVQKRMVSFGDVEEVFKRLTDAGGMFYNMQEKQSETLKGMIAKLSDALDIMLNQIGEANQGILKGFVNVTLQILQSWEKIGQVATPIISTLIIRMLALKAASLFASKPTLFKGMIDSLKLVAAQLKLTTYSLQGMKAMVSSSASVFGGWVTILSAVAIAVWEVVKAVQAHNKEQKELNQVAIESTYDAHKLTARYETLVGIIKDQTKSFQEQKAAIDELKRTYGDILPAEMLEIENIRTMGGEYDKARQAIYSYIEARAKQKQIEVIEANEGSDFQKEQAKLVSRLLKSLQGLNVPAQRFEITNIINQVFDAQRRGMIETLEDAQKMIVDLVEQTYELSWAQEDLVKAGLNLADEDNWYMGDITYILDKTLKAGTAYNKAIEQISNQSVSVLDASQRKLEEARKKFEQEYAYIPEAFQSTQYWDKMTEAQKDRTLYILRNFYTEMGEEMPDWSTLFNNPLRFDEETRRFNQMWLDAQVLDVSRHYDAVEKITDSTTQVLQATWDKFTQDVQQKIDTQNLEDWQNLIISGIYQFADANNISLDGMNSIVLKSGQTMDDYFKGIQGDVDRLKQDIGQAKLDRENFPNALQPTSDESLRNMEEQLALYEYIMSLYYDAKNADKESDKDDREALNLLKERVKLIQEANKEYEKNLQYFTQEEAAAKTINSYKNAFKQAGISNLLDEKFLTDEGVLNALAQLPINVGGKLRDEALQYMADTTAKVSVELDVDASQRNLKDLKTQVEGLFDGIDVFQDLAKIGFTEEEVRRIFGIEITNTEQLRRRLEEMKDEFVGTKGIDDYNAFMRKIDEIEDKQNVERLKRYEKYLKTMMRETAEIRIQALQDIQDVMKMQGRTSDEKTAIIEGINKEAQKKLQEQQWKQFQESDDYQLLFSDIEHLSTTTASRLKNILDELRTSLNELTPHQLRQIQAQYEKLDEQIIKHNPFEAVRKSMEAIKGLASESELNEMMLGLTEQKENAQQVIDDIDVILSMREKGIKYDDLDAKKQKELAEYRDMSKEELLAMRKEQEAMLDGIMAEMGLTEKQINLYKRLRKAMTEADNTWKSVMSSTRQVLSDIKGAYEAINDGEKSITLEIVDAGIALADASYQMVELLRNFKTFKKEAPGLGAALNTSLGIIGLIATAVQTIINVINMIASAHDETLEEDIKAYENRVNRLADAYDLLSNKIQKAYSFALLATSTNQGLTNLQEQVMAYESMIEAERDKKDSDDERIQEWADKVEELRAKMEETKNEAVREAGGLGGEYKDAAQGFVDAWMQAFRETGNGLDALNEHFEDFLWEIAGKQLLLRAADRFFAPLFEELDTRMTADTTAYDRAEKEMLDKIDKNKQVLESVAHMPYEMAKELRDSGERTFGDFGKYFDDIEKDEEKLKQIQIARQQAIQDALMLDDDDFEALKKQYEVSGRNFDDFAKNLLASLGFKGGEEGDMLSGLQKGIQGITESTAEIIEAYLNSVRFFVSDSNQKLTELLERFATNDETRSPILEQLKAQTRYLASIERALSTIIDPSGWREGGAVLKVRM